MLQWWALWPERRQRVGKLSIAQRRIRRIVRVAKRRGMDSLVIWFTMVWYGFYRDDSHWKGNRIPMEMQTASSYPLVKCDIPSGNLFPRIKGVYLSSVSGQYSTGWWFGPCSIFPCIGNEWNGDPKWRTHIFQRGRLKPSTRSIDYP